MKKTSRRPARGRQFVRATSLATTALLVIFLVLVVLVFDALENRFALRADFSFNGITTLESQTHEALQNLSRDVHIYALFTPGQEDAALLGLLERYAAASPHITFSQENLLKNPMLANQFSDLPSDQQVTTDSLVITCKDTGRTRVLDGTHYIAQSYNVQTGGYAITGFTYEKSLTEAILFVTSDQLPTIRLLTGHGELAGNATSALVSVLKDANFEVTPLNLLAGEELHPQDVLFILSPGRDLLGQELETIQGFVAQGGSLLITSDYDAPEQLPGFTVLYQQFGFALKPGIVVARRDKPGSYYENPIYLMPYMQLSPVTANLVAAQQTTLIMPGARALEILPQTPGVNVQVLLKSGDAYIKTVSDASQSLEKDEGDEQGQFALALFSELDIGNDLSARAFVLGSSATLTDAWLHTNTYSIELLMQALDALGARPSINLDIAQKQAIRRPLMTGDTMLPVLLLVLVPLLVIIPALLVYCSRRQKA